MRVLILSDLYPTVASPQGGSFVMERINALGAAGIEVHAIALRPRPTRLLAATLRVMGRSMSEGVDGVLRDSPFRLGVLDYIRTTRRSPSARLVRRIADVVETDQAGFPPPDVVHAHGMYRAKAGIVAAEVSRRLRIPYVMTLHGSDVNTHMRRDPQPFIDALRGSSRAIFVSEALRDAAIELGAPETNTVVIPNGVDVDLFVPGVKSTDEPVISFVGGLAEVKGADRLPAIFRGVARQLPSAKFEVVGRGHLGKRLESEMAGLPVTFHGHVHRSEVAEVLARTSVLVVPSRSEGWGCVVLEAHAAGAVAVATRVGGLVESVGDDRFLAPASTGIEGLVERIVHGVTEPREYLPRRAQKYRWTELAASEVAVYRSAVEA